MTSRDFCFWLQGFFEINNAATSNSGLTPSQTELVQQRLALVFKHEIDPSMIDAEHQAMLNEIRYPGSQFGATDGIDFSLVRPRC